VSCFPLYLLRARLHTCTPRGSARTVSATCHDALRRHKRRYLIPHPPLPSHCTFFIQHSRPSHPCLCYFLLLVVLLFPTIHRIQLCSRLRWRLWRHIRPANTTTPKAWHLLAGTNCCNYLTRPAVLPRRDQDGDSTLLGNGKSKTTRQQEKGIRGRGRIDVQCSTGGLDGDE